MSLQDAIKPHDGLPCRYRLQREHKDYPLSVNTCVMPDPSCLLIAASILNLCSEIQLLDFLTSCVYISALVILTIVLDLTCESCSCECYQAHTSRQLVDPLVIKMQRVIEIERVVQREWAILPLSGDNQTNLNYFLPFDMIVRSTWLKGDGSGAVTGFWDKIRHVLVGENDITSIVNSNHRYVLAVAIPSTSSNTRPCSRKRRMACMMAHRDIWEARLRACPHSPCPP